MTILTIESTGTNLQSILSVFHTRNFDSEHLRPKTLQKLRLYWFTKLILKEIALIHKSTSDVRVSTFSGIVSSFENKQPT